ncbi:hypothetical protein niasHT_026165 [Heterodera trifolii]|uniref:Protein kinase domain-containing protein n=1 Tax=Heterodera trifolii TaxID=157864 RepID=A0ABD2K1X0_9BILA
MPQVTVYMAFAADQFEGSNNCYGDINSKFNSCYPDINQILGYIGEACGYPKYNSESVGIRAVIPDNDGKIGIAWSLPDSAVRREVIKRNCDVGKRQWQVIIALLQKKSIATNFINALHYPYNSSDSNCILPKIDSINDGLQSSAIFIAILATALALNVLLVIAICVVSALIYTFVKRIRHRGSFGFYFKAAWLFVPKLSENELNNTLIDVEHLIYSGPNSRVYFARYRFSATAHRSAVVKVPSKDAFRVQAIIAETRINAQLRHPRVVEYVGFYRDAFDDIRIVSEFMGGGDLHTFLVDKRNTINVGHIFNFIGQIAEGMEYLIQKRIIHRDLAARNCMLNEEGTSIKIADFGLSRHFNTDANYASSSPVSLPFRWMPLECFDENGEILHQCKFNEKTDVWSFGVVVWECFARGAQPYGSAEFQRVIADLKKHFAKGVPISATNHSAADHPPNYDHYHHHHYLSVVDHCAIREGYRLRKPEKCPQILYDQLMLKCWADKQEMRPTFGTIRQTLDEIFTAIIGIYPDTLIQTVE